MLNRSAVDLSRATQRCCSNKSTSSIASRLCRQSTATRIQRLPHFNHQQSRSFWEVAGADRPVKWTDFHIYGWGVSLVVSVGLWAAAPTTEERHMKAMKKYNIKFDQPADYSIQKHHHEAHHHEEQQHAADEHH